MSTPTVPRPRLTGDSDRADGVDGADESVRAQLTEMLTASIFPATVDELQASLIRRRAPARLMWHLSRLSPQRRYQSMSAVLADLDGAEGL
ncbi:MAG TPA: hypothetical protein VGN48_07910 [Pedococcus sp.]|nr:hypothetical protein [Pedococcus sp.]